MPTDDGVDFLCDLASSVGSSGARRRGDREVARQDAPPAHDPSFAHSFLRQWVSRSEPVIFSGVCDRWPALSRWSHAYLRERLGAKRIHVSITPNGLADAVTPVERAQGAREGEDLVFAQPLEVSMPCDRFLDVIESPLVEEGSDRRLRNVHYASHQDSSLHTDFMELAEDFAPSIAWADAAFGNVPAATNIWIGENAARTTVHADLFDNLYLVVTGEKHFTLLPPDEGIRLERRQYRAATYSREASSHVPKQAMPGFRCGGSLDALAESIGRSKLTACITSDRASGAANDSGASPATNADDWAETGSRDDLVLHLDDPPRMVWWSPIDIESEQADEELEPIHAVVRRGELLYIPKLWWHAVSQNAPEGSSTVALNFWYEDSSEETRTCGGSGTQADAARMRSV
eukprot:scaffold157274_cov22-Tisochrysis_lutea.AAC.1